VKKLIGVLLTVALVMGLASTVWAQKTIEFWSYLGEEKSMVWINDKIGQFEAANPEVKIKYTVFDYGQIVDKTMVATAGGAPPDMATMWSPMQVPGWVESGMLVNLDDYLKDIDLSDWSSAAWDLVTYKGSKWAVPFGVDDWALIYNKERFRKVGLDDSRGPETIAELDEYAEKLYELDEEGNIIKCGFAPWLPEDWSFNWAVVFGGEFYDEATGKITANHPKNVEALQWELDNYVLRFGREKMIEYMATTSPGYGGRAIAESPIYTGEIAMYHAGDWYPILFIEQYNPELDYGATYLPYPKGGRKMSSQLIASVAVIPAGAKNPDEAFDFIKFLFMEPDSQLEYCIRGADMPLQKSLEGDFLKEYPIMETWTKLLSEGNPYPLPVIPVVGKYWSEMITARDYVIYGEKTPQEALDDITKVLQDELDKILGKK